MKSFALLVSALLPAIGMAETAQERLKAASEVFSEVMVTPDQGVPQDLLESAHCIVIVPGMKKAALGIGGQYGRGYALCRQPGGSGWGAPGAVRVEGGSFGFQIGASSTDVIMLVMKQRGMDKLLSSKFTLGADATVAAGPVGRQATAGTDARLSAEILSYSRSKGLFAGVSLAGATMRNDLDQNKELYGKPVTNKEVIGSNMAVPDAAQPLIAQLNKYSFHEAAAGTAASPATSTAGHQK